MTGCAFCGAKGLRVCDHCQRRNVVADVVGLLLRPEPVELTVEDVLGALSGCLSSGWEMFLPGGYAMLARWGLDGEGAFVLDHDGHEDFKGTLRDVLTEAKKRGLL